MQALQVQFQTRKINGKFHHLAFALDMFKRRNSFTPIWLCVHPVLLFAMCLPGVGFAKRVQQL
jgi:hypothetical protein